ncbi:MAG: arylesterase, partial [Gammaproteobacteria bacterium]|nr:arylesterase [Gammaproteobacteria bacterium]
LSLAAMRKNLSFIVQACQQQKAKVLLVGIRLPPNYGPLYVQKFQQSFAFVAEEHEIPIVPYMLDIIGEDYRYFQRDRIHPNRLGQPIILDNIWPQLEKLL